MIDANTKLMLDVNVYVRLKDNTVIEKKYRIAVNNNAFDINKSNLSAYIQEGVKTLENDLNNDMKELE